MAVKQLKVTFQSGNISIARATTLTTDLLNAFLTEIGSDDYRVFAFDNYSIIGLKGTPYFLGREILFALGNVYVDGYNKAVGRGVVIDGYRLFGLTTI